MQFASVWSTPRPTELCPQIGDDRKLLGLIPQSTEKRIQFVRSRSTAYCVVSMILSERSEPKHTVA